jgi:hypothetical protein
MPASSAGAVTFVSDEREDPPSAPVVDMKRADWATPELPSRQEQVVAEGRETLAVSQPLTREPAEHEPRARTLETRSARSAPIVGDASVAEFPPPRAGSRDEGSYGTLLQSRSRALLVTVVAAVSVAAGFGGGFIAGRHSTPSTERVDISHDEAVVEPQPARVPAEDPEPASTTQTVAAVSKEKVSSPEPSAATVARQPAAPAVDSGRLLVRSTPAGAGVVIDGRSRGVTPLDLRKLAFGTHTIKVSHPGHDTRQRRVTLSERRPARSVDFELRPTRVPSDATPAATTSGSLLVTSSPSGAQVFVDDSLIATTPLLLSNVAAGVRHLRIELSGYKIWTTSVQVEPSARSRVSADLEP